MIDSKLLNQYIKDSGLKKEYIARELGITRQGLRLKIENKRPFKLDEIPPLCNMLSIEDLNVRDEIFFANDVLENDNINK